MHLNLNPKIFPNGHVYNISKDYFCLYDRVVQIR